MADYFCNWRYVALTDGKGGLTIIIEKQAWDSTVHESGAKFFPQDYATEPEDLSFELQKLMSSSKDGVTWPPAKLGVWRSHFRARISGARTEAEDPGGYANASTNAS